MFAELLPLVAHADAGSGMPDHDEHSLAIARHWGFEVLGHGIDSVLELAEQPPAPGLPHAVEQRIVRGADVAASGLDVDAFLAQVGDFPEVEIYGSRLTNAILLQMAPDLVWVLLVDADGVLAGSSLMPTDEGPWFIGFTGSAPRARGRGLARAAKQAVHRYAFDAGPAPCGPPTRSATSACGRSTPRWATSRSAATCASSVVTAPSRRLVRG